MKKRKLVLVLFSAALFHTAFISAAHASSGSTSADVTFTSGVLSITQSSVLGFGSHTISSTLQTYPAVDENVYIEVEDLRGTGIGWKVSAVCTPFTSGENTLPGAIIRLVGGNLTQPATVTGGPPTVAPLIKLDCDGASSSSVATAAADQGMGTWRISWVGPTDNNENVTLEVPGGVARILPYNATINWTLEDAP